MGVGADPVEHAANDPGSAGLGRRVAFRVMAAVFALVWLTFCFGLIDYLAITGLAGASDDSDVSADVGLLSVAYGSVAVFLVAGAFFAQCFAPYGWPAGLRQVGVLIASFGIAGALGLDPLSFISVATLLIMLAALFGLHPRPRPRLLPSRSGHDRHRLDRPAGLVALLGAGPAMAYGWVMLANSRDRLIPEEDALRPQAGGWAGAAVLAIAAVLLALLATTRMPGRRLPAWTTLLATASVAVTSVVEPELPGSPGRTWGFAAAGWALALVVAVEMSLRREGRSPSD